METSENTIRPSDGALSHLTLNTPEDIRTTGPVPTNTDGFESHGRRCWAEAGSHMVGLVRVGGPVDGGLCGG